jgi:hypothetical protein
MVEVAGCGSRAFYKAKRGRRPLANAEKRADILRLDIFTAICNVLLL